MPVCVAVEKQIYNDFVAARAQATLIRKNVRHTTMKRLKLGLVLEVVVKTSAHSKTVPLAHGEMAIEA